MFGRNKTRPESVEVDVPGLKLMLEHLYHETGNFSSLSYGINIAVRPSFNDVDKWIVLLSSHQTEVLLNRLPRRTLQDEYGSSA